MAIEHQTWLETSLLINGHSKGSQQRVRLQDNLLVSCNAEAGMGGLLHVQKSDWLGTIKPTILDRLGTTGFWLEPTYYIRSVMLSKYMMLIASGSWGATWVIPSNELSDVHDVRIFRDKLYAVSTGTNEVFQMTLEGKIENRITFPGGEDSWHINCLGVYDDRLVLSCLGRSDSPSGWRNLSKGSGCIFDLLTEETIWDGLNSPHTPRQMDGRYFVCDSGTGRLLFRTQDKSVNEVCFDGCFSRGLAFGENHVYVGLSRLRAYQKDGEPDATASIAILDRKTLEKQAEIAIPFREIYDIVVLPSN